MVSKVDTYFSISPVCKITVKNKRFFLAMCYFRTIFEENNPFPVRNMRDAVWQEIEKLNREFINLGIGRTARLLMNYIQFCYSLFPATVFKEDRADYILSLRQSQDEVSSRPFLDFMAVQLRKSLALEIENYRKSNIKGFSFMF